MNIKIRYFVLGFLVALAGTARVAAQPLPAPAANGPVVTNAPAPKIEFAELIYDFGRVRSGEDVPHTYIFTNTGNKTLEVASVQPQCGCTAAGDWTRVVEPGKTGSIPISFHTASWSGSVQKSITVTCNDLPTPITLQLKGTIWRPIDVIPAFATFNLSADMPSATSVVRFINNTEETISLSTPEVNNRCFNVTLNTNRLGKECQATISVLPPLAAGPLSGEVTIKTTSTNTPLLRVQIMGNVQPAIVVAPPQIFLQQAPLAAKMAPVVTIQNLSTNPVSLTDAAVNATGVEVSLNTMQTGRLYSATLTFPEGFEIPAGQQIFFTLKSSNPQFPLVKVPVIQSPRPAAPPTPPSPNPVASHS